MSDKKNIESVLESLKESFEFEFFLEANRKSVLHAIERNYNPEIIKNYHVSDLIPRKGKDGYVVKFEKRIVPLSNEEYQKQYWEIKKDE